MPVWGCVGATGTDQLIRLCLHLCVQAAEIKGWFWFKGEAGMQGEVCFSQTLFHNSSLPGDLSLEVSFQTLVYK